MSTTRTCIPDMGRRAWMRSVCGAAVGSSVALAPATDAGRGRAASVSRSASDVTLAILRAEAGDAESGPEAQGLAFGLEEARHVSDLLRIPLRVTELEPAAALARDAHGAAIVTATGATDAAAALAARHSDVWIVSTRTIGVPGSARHGSVAAAPPAREAASAAAGGSAAVLEWDGRLRRYGAAQLNERYRRVTGTAMDSAAWRGWMACKVSIEFLLNRARHDTEVSLFELGFDGHKGQALRFDPASHHLVQPLYVVTGDADAPLREVRPDGSVR